MVQCIFITEICSKIFIFAVFNEILCQFDIILQNQNFHRQHDHQHKKLARGNRKSDILLSKLILWENKIEINTKTLYNEFSIKLFTTICKINKKIAKIPAAC